MWNYVFGRHATEKYKWQILFVLLSNAEVWNAWRFNDVSYTLLLDMRVN